MKKSRIYQELDQAKNTKKVVPDKLKHNVKIKELLSEVVFHQKRKGMFGDTPEDENADKEIVIPTEVKPLMKKNVNFKLYCDMLMEKNDKQRVTIDLNQFCKIRFSNCGLPEIIVRLFSFLAQELPSDIAKKKSA